MHTGRENGLPLGWTLRDTFVRRIVLETASGLIIDRGSVEVLSYYCFHEEPEPRVEYALGWADPLLGERFYVGAADPSTDPALALDICRVKTVRGYETWYVGVAATALIERKIAEWTGAVAS